MIERSGGHLELRCDGTFNGSTCGRWLASVVIRHDRAVLKIGKCRCGSFLEIDLTELMIEAEKLRREENRRQGPGTRRAFGGA